MSVPNDKMDKHVYATQRSKQHDLAYYLAGLSNYDSQYMLCTEQMQSIYLSGMEDVRTRFSPGPVTKNITDSCQVLGMIRQHICTFKFFSLSISITSVSSKSSHLA